MNIENILRDSKATKLVFQFFPERKTYIFEAGLYKTKMWIISAYGRTPEEVFEHLVKRLKEKDIIK